MQNSFLNWVLISRAGAYFMVTAVFLYLFNNYLVYWQNLPGTYALSLHFGWTGDEADSLSEDQVWQALIQLYSYLTVLGLSIFYSIKRSSIDLEDEVKRFSDLSAYLIRSCFWAVLLIGISDTVISILRVENFLEFWVSPELEVELGRPTYRSLNLHFPLIVMSFVIAVFIRNISFTWLALMVVLSEFSIVITRFVFSYEQAYMGDVVRFWYAALFLFASANTLVEEGHVRVDVLYASLKRKTKAWTNVVGISLLGFPICWVILMQGMGGKANSINSPLLSFEISQSGYGLYVKYLMAGFLVVFAVSMIVQFVSYILHNVYILNSEESEDEEMESYNNICSMGSSTLKRES